MNSSILSASGRGSFLAPLGFVVGDGRFDVGWSDLFDTEGFPARWYCGDWTALHGWTHVVADVTIFFAYMAIPASIAYFMWRHREMRLPRVGWLFAAFIFSCGFTHLIEATLFWHPWYRLSAAMKVITAIVSTATVVAIYRQMPTLQNLPGLQKLLADRTKELRESEERSRLIVESIKDYAIFMLDPEGRVVTWNSGAERIIGYRAEEVVGRSFNLFYSPEDVAAGVPQKELARARETGHLESEGWRVRKDGSRFWAHTALAAAYDENGQLRGFSKVTRDVTEQREAEGKLHEQRELMNRLFEHLAEGVVACDETGQLTFFNRAAREWHGQEAKAVATEDLPKSYHLFQADGVTPLPAQSVPLFRALRGEKVRNEEMSIVVPGRPPRFVRVNGDAFKNGDGEYLLGAVVVIHDITEQKRAEESQRIASERLRLAALAGNVGIWDWSVGTMTTAINEQLATIYGLGCGAGDVSSIEMRERVHPEDRDRASGVLRKALNDRQGSFQLEFRIVRLNDGAVRTIRAVAIIIADQSGEPQRVIGTNFDVTDERNHEHELAAALERQKDLTQAAQAGEQAKSEFLAVMSHEIRTPLNGILGFADMLSRSPTLSREDQASAQTISISGYALLRILNDVLDFSQMEAGQLKTQKSAFSLRELLAEVEALFSHRMHELGIDFHVGMVGDVPAEALGDDGRLRQVLLNLVGNALKFTEQGSIRLELRCTEHPIMGRSLDFGVVDTGVGIPGDQIDSIFHAFQQADSTLARRHGGSGLGLAISQRLTQLMGGTMEVSSRVGEGSTFVLRIPFVPPDAAAPVKFTPSAVTLEAGFARRHPLRILIVEDDRVNLKLVQLITRKLGFEPTVARDGREAIERWEEARPDCILMDLQMPLMDGIEATSHIRELERESGKAPCYIVALTANTVFTDQQLCFEAGMNAYLNKPLQPAEYVRMLMEAHRHQNGHSGIERRIDPTGEA